jgi:gliding motility-associated-like protein
LLVTLWTTYRGEVSQLWDFGDGTQIANVDTVSHWYLSAGTFTVTHYIADPRMVCKPDDTAKIAFSLSPLDVSISIPDSNGCIPFTVIVTGNSGLLSTSYFWNFGGGDTAGGNPVSHIYSNVGTYTIKVIAVDTNACVGVDSAFATVSTRNDSVYAAFQLNVLQDCDSVLQINLVNQSTNALQYQWFFGDGTGSDSANASHSYHAIGTYTVTLIATDTARCRPVDTVSKKVTLLPNALVNFAANDTCAGYAIQFINLGKTSARYVWYFGDNELSGQYSPVHLYLNYGTYDVQLIIFDSATCNIEDTATHTITLYQAPIAGFNAPDTVLLGSAITFMENSLYYEHLTWSFGDSSALDTDENDPVHTYQKPGFMDVCITATNGKCADSLCKDIYVNFVPLIGVPNAFSPNGDGINDVLFVEGQGITDMTFIIYNRWGQKVFESHDINQGWDGTFNGVMQEVDAYAYTLQATFVNGQSVSKKGNITLLK